ncbi:MAG TPA: SusC/RagA family TonB-linked outer membrane protein [Balneolaceae bacterium]
MAKKLLSLIYMCLFFVSFAIAQTGTLTGTVTDQETGRPLPGVNIYIPELERGAATNAQGEYTIEGIDFGTYTLRATYIGFQTYKDQVVVDAETVTQDISLIPQTQQLDDVVVTALGIERQERSLGYSVQEVSGADLNAIQESNFVGTLTGKIAGANITNSNAIGGSSRIVLRGVNSLTGNNQPLFVVDGIPISNANFTTANQRRGAGGYDYGNAASIINPNNIASVTVLKGAGAAALYGSRAANGVIQITTKDGSAAQGGLGVFINSGVTVTQVFGLPDYQNLYGGGSNAPFRVNGEGQLVVDFATDESWGPRLDGRPVRQWYSYDNVNGLLGQTTPWVAHPNNVTDFFNNGIKFDNSIAFAQGAEDYNFRLSLSNMQQTGIYPNSKFQRNQVSFNGTLHLNDKLSATISTNYIYSDVRGRPGTGYANQNVFLQFNHFGQRQIDLGEESYMADIFRPDGSQRAWNWADPVLGTIRFTDNPYWVRRMNYQDDDTQRIYGKVALSYEFTENLSLTADVGTDFYTERRAERVAVGSQAVSNYNEQVLEVQETNAQVTLDYARDFTDAFSFDAFVGGNARYEDLSQNIAESQGGLSAPEVYTIENSVSRPTITDIFQKELVLSLFGSATIGYENMLFLDLGLRNDWSSTLPLGNNSYLYPSASASFVFSELGMFNDSEVLDFAQLRVGWSQVGNDTEPYRLAFTYPFDIPFGDLPQLSVQNTLSNPNLRPETTTAWEVGTRLEFFNSRLNLDVTYYNEETVNQILDVEVSRGSGFDRILLNAGTLTNEGVEVALNVTPVQSLSNGLTWSIGVNWARNVNTVTELTPGITTLTLGIAPFNVDIAARVGETYGVILGTDFVYDENGNKVISPDGTYLATNQPQVLGSYVPDWSGGLSTTLHYRGFTLAAAVNGQKGGSVYSVSNAFGLYSGMFEETVENDIREVGMTPEGVLPSGEPYTGVVGPETFFKGLFSVAAAHVYDASFIKLQQVSLSYTLPIEWFENTPISGLQVSLLGRNLAILYKESPNIDPTNVISSTNVQGIEAGQIPPQRSYGFSVQLNL